MRLKNNMCRHGKQEHPFPEAVEWQQQHILPVCGSRSLLCHKATSGWFSYCPGLGVCAFFVSSLIFSLKSKHSHETIQHSTCRIYSSCEESSTCCSLFLAAGIQCCLSEEKALVLRELDHKLAHLKSFWIVMKVKTTNRTERSNKTEA